MNILLKNLFSATLMVSSLMVCAQQNASGQSSMAYLEQMFPKLTNLYKPELSNCHTHYIFAVDVSGSMRRYNDVVTPALQAFAKALPTGEQVSVIPFGADAKENTPGLCTTIETEAQKRVLNTALNTLYVNDGYSKEFRANTDVNKAVAAVNKAILNNQQAQMNVVVIITDFLNDLPGVGEQKLKDPDLQQLNKDFDNVTNGKYTRVVAMQLPKAGTGAGFCLDQLQNSVFCNTSRTKRFDIIQAINDQAAISHWFEQLTRDIMTEKLKAVIQLDNERALRPALSTQVDIDGNTTAEFRWTPNKLYKQIKLEDVCTDEKSKYTFTSNPAVLQTTGDTVLVEMQLGKLTHKNYGFRMCDENINLQLSFPTDYDDELNRLSIEKPVQVATDKHSGWLFTFFLPLWLTITLLVLFILYVIAVIKSILRNMNERFVGTVDFSDHRGRDIGDTINVKANPSRTVLIGNGGNSGCNLDSAAWTIQLVKKTPSPLLFWKRPAFEWSAKSGFVCDGKNKKRGLLGRYDKDNTRKVITVDCGATSDKMTHSVKIRIKN